MSMPNIPDINPDICICFEDVIKLLLSSVALQEIALSNVINAESEKLQSVIRRKDHCYTVNELISLNESIEKVLYEVSSIETLLITKIKNIAKLREKSEKNCECPDYDECYENCSNINSELNHICSDYIDNLNCKCNNDFEDECDCDSENKYEEDEQTKHFKVKKNKNKIEDKTTVKEPYQNVSSNNLNTNYTYNKNPYYQNYNKVSDMLNKILGRGGNKQT